jgi:hypothetical protein
VDPQLAIWRTRSHETWPSPGRAARVERGSAPCAAALVSRSTAVPRGCGALVPAPAETSRNSAVDVEHVRHPHPVQGAVDRAAGHVEISVPINVDEAQPRAAVQYSGDGADTNGAISSEDQNRVPGWS